MKKLEMYCTTVNKNRLKIRLHVWRYGSVTVSVPSMHTALGGAATQDYSKL